MPGQCVFSVHWLEDEQYSQWLTSVADQHKALCKLCLKDIDTGNMGESALKRHAAGVKHKELIKFLEKDTKVMDFLKPASAATAKKSCNTMSQDKNSSSVSSPQTTGGASVSGIASFVSPQETLSAEILWTLKSVTAHYSYSSSSDTSTLFQRMFPTVRLHRNSLVAR